MPKKITFTHLCGQLNFYTFQQDRALARTACEMVEFLHYKMPDFMPPCCLVLIQ